MCTVCSKHLSNSGSTETKTRCTCQLDQLALQAHVSSS